MKNVRVLPILKKSSIITPQNKEDIKPSDIDCIVDFYCDQLFDTTILHGFEKDQQFLRDFDFVKDFYRSALLRNVGKYHHFQDYIDDFDEFIENKQKEDD
jgi:hypothetical protein